LFPITPAARMNGIHAVFLLSFYNQNRIINDGLMIREADGNGFNAERDEPEH
jgi:hypothetical protein